MWVRRLARARLAPRCRKTWMPGTSPGMTVGGKSDAYGRAATGVPIRGPPSTWASGRQIATDSTFASVECRAGMSTFADSTRLSTLPSANADRARGTCGSAYSTCRSDARPGTPPSRGAPSAARTRRRPHPATKRGAGISSGAPTSRLWEIWCDSRPGSSRKFVKRINYFPTSRKKTIFSPFRFHPGTSPGRRSCRGRYLWISRPV